MGRSSSASSLVIGGPPRVNLMPPAELERRYRRTLLKRWVLALVSAVLVALLVIGGAGALRFLADMRLAAERDRTNALIAEIASLATVGDTVNTLSDLEAYREEAMVADLEWSALLESLRANLPAEVSIVGFEVTSGSGAVADDPATAPGATVLLTLRSPVSFDIVGAIRGIRSSPGILMADGTGLRAEEADGGFLADLAVTMSQDVYSGRFAPKEDEE